MFSEPFSKPASSFRLLEASKFSPHHLSSWLKAQERGIFSVGVILGVIVLYVARYFASPFRKLPPGPRGYPVIGNLLELKSGQWLKFAAWQKDYGELIYLNVAGQPIVVLNSHRVAVDLLDRRSGIYSGRPQNIVACDIMTGGLLFALAEYGDTWRRMRKASHEGFNRGVVKRFYEMQTTEAVLMAYDLLAEPAKWDRHLNRTAASTILSIIYKHPPLTSERDDVVLAITRFADRVTHAAYPGSYFVEFLPWMRYIPSRMAKWKRDAEECFKQASAMFEGLLHAVEANMAKGSDDQSLGATLIGDVDKNKLSPRERSWLAGTLCIGGTDSSSVSLAWWMLAMLAYPETQDRAHSELDAVVGRARLPTFSDYPHLPYIRAMIKELLRWRPVAPLGLPHQLTENDWYQGMFIPKGTICISNIWQINRDSEIYGENAALFDPARHLDPDGKIASDPSDSKEEGHFSYGFGRRKCPGRHVANNSLFIEIAVTLWASKIGRKKDALGKFLPLDLDGFIDHGIVVRPIPFECEITPRFPEASGLLSQERELRG